MVRLRGQKSQRVATKLAAGLALTLLAIAGEKQAFAGDKDAAMALFQDGRKLVKEGKFDEACTKFKAAQRLHPSPGILLNVANCHATENRTALAYKEFSEAAKQFAAAGRERAQAEAERRAKELKSRLIFVTIKPPQAKDVRIEFNHQPLTPDQLNKPFPIDPGKVRVDVVYKDRTRWDSEFRVEEGKGPYEVLVPEPKVEKTPVVAPPPGPVPPAKDPMPPPPKEERSLALPIALGSVGVVALGVGAVFGFQALSANSDFESLCADSTSPQCQGEGLDKADQRDSAALLSTILVPAGAVLLGVGGYLYFSGDEESKSSVAATVNLGPNGQPNLGLVGRF